MVSVQFKSNLFQNIEVWLLDIVIHLLSSSIFVRSFIRNTAGLVISRQIYFWGLVVGTSCLMGAASSVMLFLFISHLR